MISTFRTQRTTFENPDDHVLLPEIISKEPLGPLVRHGDDQWADVVRWVLNVLIIAEELGVTQANVDSMAKGSDIPEINRMLGSEGKYGEMLGLDNAFAVRAIKAGGNYGEIFERFVGTSTPIGLERRCVEKTTIRPLCVQTAFEANRRFHADEALKDLAVIASGFDRTDCESIVETKHLAILAFGTHRRSVKPQRRRGRGERKSESICRATACRSTGQKS